MKPAKNICSHALAYSLIQPEVRDQVASLASGTSSSHARIKRGDIYNINLASDYFQADNQKKVEHFKSAIKKMDSAGREFAGLIEITRD